jgi:TRAP-type C4-dicarboxylate transport system permease small subunit
MLIKRAKNLFAGIFSLCILILSVFSNLNAQEPRTVSNEAIEMFFVAVALIGVSFFIRRHLRG